MGWMGGLGRGMMQYGQVYGERLQKQREMEWQEAQNKLQWEREQHLQELRMKHEGALQEARLTQEAGQFETTRGLEERKLAVDEGKFNSEYMGYIDGVGLITREKAAELSEEERAKMVDMETYGMQKKMDYTLQIQQQTASFNEDQLEKQEKKINGIEGLSDEEKQIAKVALYSPTAAEALIKKQNPKPITPEQARLAHKDGLADYDMLPEDQKEEFLAKLKSSGLLEDPKATIKSMEVRRKYADGFVADAFDLLGSRGEGGTAPSQGGTLRLKPERLQVITENPDEAKKYMQTTEFSKLPSEQQRAIRAAVGARRAGEEKPSVWSTDNMSPGARSLIEKGKGMLGTIGERMDEWGAAHQNRTYR